MLHPLSPNDKKVVFTSPYGQWHVSTKNFALISETFKLLFAPLSIIPLPRDISYQAFEIIRAYTRHPNSSTLNFEDSKSCLPKEQAKIPSILDMFNTINKNEEWEKIFDIVKVITDVYEFSSKWGIKRPLREAARYSFEHFSPEVIIDIILKLSTERINEDNKLNDIDTKIFKSSFDPKYVGYDYTGITDTSELDSVVAHHIEQYVHLLRRLPFYKINQILCKVKSIQQGNGTSKKHRKSEDISVLSVSIDDLLLDFIMNDLENVDYRTKEILISRYINLNECSIAKLQKFNLINSDGQYIDLTGYSLKKLIEAEDELLVVKEELNETKAKYETADKNSTEYLNGLHELFEGKHGHPEMTYLTAVRERKITPTNGAQKVDELFNVTVEAKIPESLFEKAKSLETVDSKQSLSIYQELTTNFTPQSDQLVSQHIIELANHQERNLATSILKMFVKTNRPKMLLTAYEVSLIDYKVISSVTGERCLKRAVRLGDKESCRAYCDYLVAKDPTQCLKFCLDHSDQDPAFSFNIGSILLLGCKGPTVPIDSSSSCCSSTKEVEIEEVKIEPLASPVTLPESPYLPSPRGESKGGAGVSPFNERNPSEGEMFNLQEFMENTRKPEKVDKTIEPVPWKSIKYFERAAVKGFNVANLVLSVISNSDRRRKEHYEKFMINSSSKKDLNSGDRIYPRTKFVVRVILSLFDLIIETYPDLEKEMFGLVNSLVVHDRDASTAEFLITRSSSANVFEALTQQTPKLSDYLQYVVDDLRQRSVSQVPALLSNVHKVKEEEFREKNNINEVLRFPEYLEAIGDRAFYKCGSLKSIQFDYEIHKSRKNQSNSSSSQKQYFLKSIGKYAFYGCNELQAIFFNKVKDETNGDSSVGIRSLSLGVSAFNHCSNLCYVELPENLLRIDERLFYSCEKLVSVDIPQRTEEIGESAFEGCKSLEFIGLHNGIKVIREGCFQFCDKLRIIIIPKSIKTIPIRAFRSCISATSLLIQEGVTEIEKEAFTGCKKLGFVSFPTKSLTKICKGAFSQCPSLLKVTIPKGCTVEKGAFDEGVEISYFEGNDAEEENKKERRSSNKKSRNVSGSFSSKESDDFAFERANE